jgi:hypothetical protein
MVLSSPLAYYSTSTSVEMSCGASAPRKIWSFAFMSWLIQMERFFQPAMLPAILRHTARVRSN